MTSRTNQDPRPDPNAPQPEPKQYEFKAEPRKFLCMFGCGRMHTENDRPGACMEGKSDG